MRHAVPIVAVSLLAVVLGGCNSTRWNWLHSDKDPKPPAVPSNVTVADLVGYLITNSSRINSLDVSDLDVTVSQGIQSIGLRGNLIAEKPQNFRLKIRHPLGGDAGDLGSNKEEFWFWIAKNNPPYQFYCSYKDLAEARSLPLPFQPDWIMETLGIGSYGPPERYQPLETHGDTFHLVEKARSPQGQPVRKVIVMKRWKVKEPEPQVMAFLLLDDATGKEICSAHITKTQWDQGTRTHKGSGAILPQRVELRYPEGNVTMALKLDGVTTNTPPFATAFLRPRLNGIESFNLATRRLDSAALVPAQGFQPAVTR